MSAIPLNLIPPKSKSGNNLNFTPYQKNMIYHAPLQKGKMLYSPSSKSKKVEML